MRLASIVISFICLVLSGFLLISMVDKKSTVEKYKTDLATYNLLSEEYQSDIVSFQQELDTVTLKTESVRKEVNHEIKMNNYKLVPTVFLSFDDGTSSRTLEILDILEEFEVKGTFFVVGEQVVGNGNTGIEALKRIVQEGHTLGIHCYTHEYEKIYASVDAFFTDFYKCRDLIVQYTGISPEIVRLPSGTATARSFCEKYAGSVDVFYEILRRLLDEGYTVVDWNIDTEDYSASTTVNDIVTTVTTGAKARLGKEYCTAVILMHDNIRTVNSLPSVIQACNDLGYKNFESFESDGYVCRQVAKLYP